MEVPTFGGRITTTLPINGNELCEPMDDVPLSDVFDALNTIGK